MTCVQDQEIGVISRRLPGNPGELIDDILNIFFQIIFFATYLFYLPALGFLKKENKQIITQIQSHSTPLEKHQPSWQPLLTFFTFDRNTVYIYFYFSPMILTL